MMSFLQGAIDWIVAHKGKNELAEVISGFTKLPVSRVLSLRLWPEFAKTAKPATVDNVSQAMRKYGLIKTLPDAASLIYETARG